MDPSDGIADIRSHFVHSGYDNHFFGAVNQTGCPIAAPVNIDQFTIGGKSVGTAEKAVGLHDLSVGDIRGFAV